MDNPRFYTEYMTTKDVLKAIDMPEDEFAAHMRGNDTIWRLFREEKNDKLQLILGKHRCLINDYGLLCNVVRSSVRRKDNYIQELLEFVGKDAYFNMFEGCLDDVINGGNSQKLTEFCDVMCIGLKYEQLEENVVFKITYSTMCKYEKTALAWFGHRGIIESISNIYLQENHKQEYEHVKEFYYTFKESLNAMYAYNLADDLEWFEKVMKF